MCHYRLKSATCMLAAVVLMMLATTAIAAKPVSIGVIAPASAINGRAIFQGVRLATDEINANGGIDGRQIELHEYDDHASATDGIRAFQRAVKQDNTVAVLGNFTSEVALAVQPWAARLKQPYIVTGAATTKIPQRIHEQYEQYKYVFRVNLNSAFLAKNVCATAKAVLVGQLGYKTAVIMSENAAWTKPLDAEYMSCLPKAGLKVLDHIRFSPDTTDFSPIFSRIRKSSPDAIISGIAHVGVKPTIQWHQNQVPALLAGWSSQAGSSSFWKDTSGAANGVITGNLGASAAALTDKSIPFAKAYTKRFNESPAYDAYTSYDAVYVLKKAVERASSDDADALVTALEKTDYTGAIGQIQFYPKTSEYAHDTKYGKKYVPGVAIQWQQGKQVIIWPPQAKTGDVVLPGFVPKDKKGS